LITGGFMEIHAKLNQALDQAKSFIFGQDDLLESILAALVCEGHVLIEGMPGLGKTMSVSTMSKLCDLAFSRVQFTPDLLPSDLIGTMIYSQKTEAFSTKFGPLFTQLLLADEINRSPAKVQSALLEAMAERQITIGDTTHKLSSPFVVLATQNPIDQEGTYSLPEAQMDRFMMKVYVDYPSKESEIQILGLDKNFLTSIEPILSTDDLLSVQRMVDEIYVDDKMKDLIVTIVQSTRPESNLFKKEYEGAILAGASPRACIWLYKVGKYMAFMDGKEFVSPEHILKVVPQILGHRMILSYEAMLDKIKGHELALKIAKSII
jgi:MoxR-like ATPase